MEYAFYAGSDNQLNDLRGFSRIYYGVEFCQNKIPELNRLKKVFFLAKESRRKFTFVTPYVTNKGLKKMAPLLKFLEAQNQGIEVVFNDWGVFKMIKEKYRGLDPVLGRLLTKQRRDPRARDILLNKQKARKVFDKKSGKPSIIIPKNAPRSLYRSFRASVINVPVFQEFLLNKGVGRVEIDNLAWNMDIEVPKKLGVSVYLPYAYITTTRLCGLVNLTYSACAKECREFYLSPKNTSSPVPLYIRGNTVFYKSKLPDKEYLKARQINRIIWEKEVPA